MKLSATPSQSKPTIKNMAHGTKKNFFDVFGKQENIDKNSDINGISKTMDAIFRTRMECTDVKISINSALKQSPMHMQNGMSVCCTLSRYRL